MVLRTNKEAKYRENKINKDGWRRGMEGWKNTEQTKK